MAFVQIDRYTAKALEKGLSAAKKAGDCRFTSYGMDAKKNTADDVIVGPVAYYVPDSSDDTGGPGTITKLFYDCAAPNPERVVFENIHTDGIAAVQAYSWVESVSINLAEFRAKIPAVT
jgi:hypothetical protein